MTTDQKIAYIQDFVKLVSRATNYDSAWSTANFTRGVLAAWRADLSISSETFKTESENLELIMGIKRIKYKKGENL